MIPAKHLALILLSVANLCITVQPLSVDDVKNVNFFRFGNRFPQPNGVANYLYYNEDDKGPLFGFNTSLVSRDIVSLIHYSFGYWSTDDYKLQGNHLHFKDDLKRTSDSALFSAKTDEIERDELAHLTYDSVGLNSLIVLKNVNVKFDEYIQSLNFDKMTSFKNPSTATLFKGITDVYIVNNLALPVASKLQEFKAILVTTSNEVQRVSFPGDAFQNQGGDDVYLKSPEEYSYAFIYDINYANSNLRKLTDEKNSYYHIEKEQFVVNLHQEDGDGSECFQLQNLGSEPLPAVDLYLTFKDADAGIQLASLSQSNPKFCLHHYLALYFKQYMITLVFPNDEKQHLIQVTNAGKEEISLKNPHDYKNVTDWIYYNKNSLDSVNITNSKENVKICDAVANCFSLTRTVDGKVTIDTEVKKYLIGTPFVRFDHPVQFSEQIRVKSHLDEFEQNFVSSNKDFNVKIDDLSRTSNSYTFRVESGEIKIPLKGFDLRTYDLEILIDTDGQQFNVDWMRINNNPEIGLNLSSTLTIRATDLVFVTELRDTSTQDLTLTFKISQTASFAGDKIAMQFTVSPASIAPSQRQLQSSSNFKQLGTRQDGKQLFISDWISGSNDRFDLSVDVSVTSGAITSGLFFNERISESFQGGKNFPGKTFGNAFRVAYLLDVGQSLQNVDISTSTTPIGTVEGPVYSKRDCQRDGFDCALHFFPRGSLTCLLNDFYREANIQCDRASGCSNIFDRPLMVLDKAVDSDAYYPNVNNQTAFITVTRPKNSDNDFCVEFEYLADSMKLIAGVKFNDHSSANVQYSLTDDTQKKNSRSVCASELHYDASEVGQITFWFSNVNSSSHIQNHWIKLIRTNDESMKKSYEGIYQHQLDSERFFRSGFHDRSNIYVDLRDYQSWQQHQFEEQFSTKWIHLPQSGKVQIGYKLNISSFKEEFEKKNIKLSFVISTLKKQFSLDLEETKGEVLELQIDDDGNEDNRYFKVALKVQAKGLKEAVDIFVEDFSVNDPCLESSNVVKSCSGHGTCERHTDFRFKCNCDQYYGGVYCEVEDFCKLPNDKVQLTNGQICELMKIDCINGNDTFHCDCVQGYKWNGALLSCLPKSIECKVDEWPRIEVDHCMHQNTVCDCQEGLVRDAKNGCEKIKPCDLSQRKQNNQPLDVCPDPNSECKPTGRLFKDYTCPCKDAYLKHHEKQTCIEKICNIDNPCDQTCNPQSDADRCSCASDYYEKEGVHCHLKENKRYIFNATCFRKSSTEGNYTMPFLDNDGQCRCKDGYRYRNKDDGCELDVEHFKKMFGCNEIEIKSDKMAGCKCSDNEKFDTASRTCIRTSRDCFQSEIKVGTKKAYKCVPKCDVMNKKTNCPVFAHCNGTNVLLSPPKQADSDIYTEDEVQDISVIQKACSCDDRFHRYLEACIPIDDYRYKMVLKFKHSPDSYMKSIEDSLDKVIKGSVIKGSTIQFIYPKCVPSENAVSCSGFFSHSDKIGKDDVMEKLIDNSLEFKQSDGSKACIFFDEGLQSGLEMFDDVLNFRHISLHSTLIWDCEGSNQFEEIHYCDQTDRCSPFAYTKCVPKSEATNLFECICNDKNDPKSPFTVQHTYNMTFDHEVPKFLRMQNCAVQAKCPDGYCADSSAICVANVKSDYTLEYECKCPGTNYTLSDKDHTCQNTCDGYCKHGQCSLDRDWKPVCHCESGFAGATCEEKFKCEKKVEESNSSYKTATIVLAILVVLAIAVIIFIYFRSRN